MGPSSLVWKWWRARGVEPLSAMSFQIRIYRNSLSTLETGLISCPLGRSHLQLLTEVNPRMFYVVGLVIRNQGLYCEFVAT